MIITQNSKNNIKFYLKISENFEFGLNLPQGSLKRYVMHLGERK